jgi:hypothetical protein
MNPRDFGAVNGPLQIPSIRANCRVSAGPNGRGRSWAYAQRYSELDRLERGRAATPAALGFLKLERLFNLRNREAIPACTQIIQAWLR